MVSVGEMSVLIAQLNIFFWVSLSLHFFVIRSQTKLVHIIDYWNSRKEVLVDEYDGDVNKWNERISIIIMR
jgi:hypothetical protein